MRNLIVIIACVMLAAMPATAKQRKSPISISEQSRTRAAEIMNSMSMHDRVAQLVMPHMKMFDMDSARIKIDRYIGENHVGGLIFYKGECEQQIELYNRAMRQTEQPLLVAIDGEWGLIMRLRGTPRFPVNMALGAVQDAKLLEAYGREMGRQCRRMGINVNFAPVLDVNSNPDNPVIGRRAYSDKKEVVARNGISYAVGLESMGVVSCAKHFPGHGDTNQDSHKTLPTISRSRQTIFDVDLYPFRKYLQAGCNGVMVAHLNVPALDSTTGVCSSLSPVIIDGLLRGELGYDGLVFTDGLEMEGVAHNKNLYVKALLAGNDVLVIPADVDDCINQIMAALATGEITEDCINRHCLRVLAYKQELKLTTDPVKSENIIADLNTKECDDLIARLARASVTLVSDKPHRAGKVKAGQAQLIALGDDENLKYVSLGDTVVTSREFYRYIDGRFASVVSYNSKAAQLPSVDKGQTTVIEVFSAKDRYVTALAELLRATDAVVVFYVNPYEMMKFMNGIDLSRNTVICAYEDTYHAQQAAQEGIFGTRKFIGKLPVDLPL